MGMDLLALLRRCNCFLDGLQLNREVQFYTVADVSREN